MKIGTARDMALAGILVLTLAAGDASAQSRWSQGPGGFGGMGPGNRQGGFGQMNPPNGQDGRNDRQGQRSPPPEIFNSMGFVQQAGSTSLTTDSVRPFSLQVVPMMAPSLDDRQDQRDPQSRHGQDSRNRLPPLGGRVFLAGQDYFLIEVRLENETASTTDSQVKTDGTSENLSGGTAHQLERRPLGPVTAIVAKLVPPPPAPRNSQDRQNGASDQVTSSNEASSTSTDSRQNVPQPVGEVTLSVKLIDGRPCVLGTIKVKDAKDGPESSYSVFATVLHALERQPNGPPNGPDNRKGDSRGMGPGSRQGGAGDEVNRDF